MKILIDIGHPAHVHMFKYFAKEMLSKGSEVLFTCRDKEFEMDLLKNEKFTYKSFGKKYRTPFGKLIGLMEFDLKEILACIKFKPDILISHGSIYAAHAAFFLRKPHISLEDTFNFEQVRLYKPFTQAILTSDYDHPLKSGKVIRYSGYHELAYLHPKRFSPDKSILNDLKVKENEKYTIMRFVSWNASHDIGHMGISLETKVKAIKEFSHYSKVFISSESELPEILLPYQLVIPPDRIHDAIAYASLLFGESSTMAEEAAMLGIPSLYLNDNSTYYTQHLEHQYGLVLNYSESNEDQLKAIEKGSELLSKSSTKKEWESKREKMLDEKIDVTAFLVWFVEQWPESFKIMKENPDFHKIFR